MNIICTIWGHKEHSSNQYEIVYCDRCNCLIWEYGADIEHPRSLNIMVMWYWIVYQYRKFRPRSEEDDIPF